MCQHNILIVEPVSSEREWFMSVLGQNKPEQKRRQPDPARFPCFPFAASSNAIYQTGRFDSYSNFAMHNPKDKTIKD